MKNNFSLPRVDVPEPFKSLVISYLPLGLLLLTLQSFDWLAAFHLELLQAILFVAV